MLVAGLPGTGKTNFLRQLAASCMRLGDRVYVISRKGYEFSSLLLVPGLNLFDLRTTDIRLNPFYPPTKHISNEEWYAKISTALSMESWMVYASATNFYKIVTTFAEKFLATLVTPSKLIEFIHQRKAYRLLDVDEKVRNRLEGLTSGPGKAIFDTNEVWEFRFYAKNSFNFDLEGLTSNQVTYFIAVFVEMLICYKQRENDMTRVHVILDDYSDLISEEESRSKMSELVKMVTVYGRKLNIDLWIVAQSSFSLSKYILDNVSTVFRFSSGRISEDILNKLMRLSEREAEIVSKLPRGVCAVSKRF